MSDAPRFLAPGTRPKPHVVHTCRSSHTWLAGLNQARHRSGWPSLYATMSATTES